MNRQLKQKKEGKVSAPTVDPATDDTIVATVEVGENDVMDFDNDEDADGAVIDEADGREVGDDDDGQYSDAIANKRKAEEIINTLSDDELQSLIAQAKKRKQQ